MPKQNSATLLNKYIWLIDTIYSAGRISREEIDRRWARSRYNDSHENAIPERTFHRYKDAIQELFDIDIRCDKSAGAVYYIVSDEIGERGSAKRWLLSQFALNNALHESRELKGRIVYENIPGGIEFLSQIVEAMRDGKMLRMTHRSFSSTENHVYDIAPYCLKVFKQRWYLFGKSPEHHAPRLYALDRAISFETLEQSFSLPKDFDAEEYFRPYYGVFVGKQFKPELIRIRVIPEAAAYLRSLPLHASQEEDTPCEFSYYLAPTFDFIQELHTHGSNLEVLSPAWLREQFLQDAEKTVQLYKK